MTRKKEIINTIQEDIRRIESVKTDFPGLMRRIRRIRNRRIFVAASVAAVLAAIVLVLPFEKRAGQAEEASLLSAVAAPGSVTHVVLPDNTEVWLNSGSTLSYPERFSGDSREVTLSGQAYFNVTASKDYPFYVKTDEGVTVYVYGTRFDLSAYPGEEHVETILEEGSVNVLLPGEDVSCEISPMQRLTWNKNLKEMKIDNVSADEVIGWTDGSLVFRGTPIKEVLTAIGRHFGMAMDVTGSEKSGVMLHATFTSELTFSEMMSAISVLTELRWNEVGVDEYGRKHIIVNL